MQIIYTQKLGVSGRKEPDDIYLQKRFEAKSDYLPRKDDAIKDAAFDKASTAIKVEINYEKGVCDVQLGRKGFKSKEEIETYIRIAAQCGWTRI